MDKKLLGQRIKNARTARGLSLDALASAVGLNKSTISRYERGEIESPKLPVIEAIATKLHTNPAWLIGKSNDKTYTPPSSNFRLYSPSNLFGPIGNLRKARGLTIEEAAYKIGISTADYAAIESGHNTDCITLARIAEFYCCSTDFALSFDGTVNEEYHLRFTEDTLFRLHRVFSQLSPDNQENLISIAGILADRNSETLRIAARNGSYSEIRLTSSQLRRFEEFWDELPDVPDDL